MVNLFRPDTWGRRRAVAESAGDNVEGTASRLAPSTTPLPRSNGDSHTPGDGESLHQAIQELAYFKWKKAGCPVGQDQTFWLEAERELLARRR